MGFRFFRRVRLAPGLTINLSKRGASVSAGVPGAHYTVGTSGQRATVGLPGTGLYYTTHSTGRVTLGDLPRVPAPQAPGRPGCAWVVLAGLCIVWLVVWLLPRLVD